MMLSQLDLEDVEALHLGSSFLTADTVGPLLDQCEEALFALSSLEEPPTSSAPLSPTSPVHSHHALLPEAKGSDWVLPWLGASDLLDFKCPEEEDDALVGMEWVSEKLDLNELDLDSLLDSSDDCPNSPEDLLAPHSELDLFNTSSLAGPLTLESEEMAVKCEPMSPAHSMELGGEAAVTERAPANNLELGSEVDVSERTIKSSQSDSDSDSGIESSPPHTPQSCRTKPYSRPEPDNKAPRVKGVRSVEKKLKKMEQNKTAATRYRQKKRVEQEVLNDECQQLEQKNRELTERAQAISREIQYLKDLMEEVRRHHQNKTKTVAK